MTALANLTESELITLLQQGNVAAFDALYYIYSPRIHHKLLQMVRQPSIAEELLQDVFVRVWERRAKIDLEKSFRSFLYTIAVNLVSDLFRRAALDRKMMQSMVAETTEFYNPFDEMNEQEQTRIFLQQALDTLPPQRRRIYTLVKIEGKSYQQVGQELGISVSTISDHVVKATKALKTYFAEHDALLIMLVSAAIAAH